MAQRLLRVLLRERIARAISPSDLFGGAVHGRRLYIPRTSLPRVFERVGIFVTLREARLIISLLDDDDGEGGVGWAQFNALVTSPLGAAPAATRGGAPRLESLFMRRIAQHLATVAHIESDGGVDFASLFGHLSAHRCASLRLSDVASALRREHGISPKRLSKVHLGHLFHLIDKDSDRRVTSHEFASVLRDAARVHGVALQYAARAPPDAGALARARSVKRAAPLGSFGHTEVLERERERAARRLHTRERSKTGVPAKHPNVWSGGGSLNR